VEFHQSDSTEHDHDNDHQHDHEHDQEHDHEHDPNLLVYSAAKLKQIKIRGVISVIGGILLHLVLGTFYVWGTISNLFTNMLGPYVAAYMK
jgi:hypothetical protein